jgi:hypothetical protein
MCRRRAPSMLLPRMIGCSVRHIDMIAMLKIYERLSTESSKKSFAYMR